MEGLRIQTLAPNPELKPSPFPDWRRPEKFNQIKKIPAQIKRNVFNIYWHNRNKKAILNEFGMLATFNIKDKVSCAVEEAKHGMWKVASHTFEDAILQAQKVVETDAMSVYDRDFVWIDISTGLRDAGFYDQARHMLKNIKTEFYALAENALLDDYIKKERKEMAARGRKSKKA